MKPDGSVHSIGPIDGSSHFKTGADEERRWTLNVVGGGGLSGCIKRGPVLGDCAGRSRSCPASLKWISAPRLPPLLLK